MAHKKRAEFRGLPICSGNRKKSNILYKCRTVNSALNFKVSRRSTECHPNHGVIWKCLPNGRFLRKKSDLTMHSSSHRKILCLDNTSRAFNHAVECIDIGTTFPRQIRDQYAASNLTDTQAHVLFSGEGLVWRVAGDAVACSRFLNCEVASISAGLS